MKYLTIILVGIVGLSFFTYNTISINGKCLKSPYIDAKGMSVRLASIMLEKAGFKVKEEYEKISNDKVKKDKVVNTSTFIGTKGTKGTKITIYKYGNLWN